MELARNIVFFVTAMGIMNYVKFASSFATRSPTHTRLGLELGCQLGSGSGSRLSKAKRCERLALFSSSLSAKGRGIEVNVNDGVNVNVNVHMEPKADLFRPYFPIYYNDVYEVPLPPNHRFPMDKYRKVRERVQASVMKAKASASSHSDSHTHTHTYTRKGYNGNVQCDFRISPLVTVEDLVTTHCPEYVGRYLVGNLTDEEIRNVGFPWSKEGVDRAFSSTGGTVAAATSICKVKRQQKQYLLDRVHGNDAEDEDEDSTRNVNELEFGQLWSAHVAGGTHHAFRDRGEGFCVFSDIAVAANVVLRDFPDVVKKILIIDLDVHQGNGNAVLFQGIDEVTTFSMHCNANYFSEKQNSDLDIELPSGCGDETYLSTLNHWLNRVKKGDAGDIDLIFFQAGVDILEEDRLGRLSITQNGIERRNKMVFDLANSLGCPLCITMGGGYPRNDWEPILQAHANVYFQAYQYMADQINEKVNT